MKVSIRKRLSRSFSLEAEFETSGGVGCLGILGASGCGKSMTLKCIAGIETPDEGHIEINGRVLFDSAAKLDLRPQARRVGYLFQNYALFPRMTVLENIMAALPAVTVPGRGRAAEKRRKALDWVERFGLAGLEDRRPAALSGGQQQRAALARMLICGPEAILLDEPFSALDTNLREQMQARMLELLAGRDDVILVTHSRDEVFKLCGELLVMDGGRVLRKGRTRELFREPGLVAVARLTGCKNISPVRRLGEREIAALDWGLTLRTAVPVEDTITHVGIRAHDFVPVFPGEAREAGVNLVRIRVLSCSEEPFEKALLFSNAAAQGPEESHEIWWKYSNYLNYYNTEQLYIPPESLLLLRDTALFPYGQTRITNTSHTVLEKSGSPFRGDTGRFPVAGQNVNVSVQGKQSL
ncbi:MAG: ATP-binding cassette domain-containing protein [Treponema sp.]|jgi:molybdate transport system ATP-binding protein|nr:ATP-binding cassette domain-containing protein [Treponema sp.]